MRCVYGNRVNLGIVRTNENALWSLGVHDLSVILYLLDEDPDFVTAQGSWSIHDGVQDVVFCFLRFPSGKIAHMHLSWLDPHKMRKMTVVGREKMAVFDDMEPDRKVTVYEKSAGPTGELRIPATSTSRRSRPPSLCGSSAPTSSSWSTDSTTAARSPGTVRASCARSRC